MKPQSGKDYAHAFLQQNIRWTSMNGWWNQRCAFMIKGHLTICLSLQVPVIPKWLQLPIWGHSTPSHTFWFLWNTMNTTRMTNPINTVSPMPPTIPPICSVERFNQHHISYSLHCNSSSCEWNYKVIKRLHVSIPTEDAIVNWCI